jgi:hypothetical protein
MTMKTIAVVTTALLAGAFSSACGGGGGNKSDAGTSLYVKYGGAPTVEKVVDDAVNGLLADCTEGPYFAVVGTTGHDSLTRLKGCLVLQFTVLMGGPGTYPGKNSEGDMCDDMATIHNGLQIPGFVFDRFVVDLGAVLTADGVSATDVSTIASAVTGLKSQIVAASPVDKTTCGDGGEHDM